MAQRDQTNDAENPYAAPESLLTDIEPVIASQDSDTEELRAFVGDKAGYYLNKWASLREGSGRDAGFNWAAFLLNGLWLPYRKMYKAAAVLYGIILFESLAEEVLFVGILGKPTVPAGLDNIVGLAASIICGAMGNRWYYFHARKVISEVKAEGLDREARLQMISRRGGANLLLSLGFFFMFMVVMYAVFVVSGILLYSET